MKLIGQTKITTIEEPDTLEFVATREDGLVDFLFGPMVIIGFSVWAWISRDWWLIIFSIVALGYVIAYRSNGNVSKVSVNRWAFTISADVEKHPNRQTVIAPYVIKSLGYSSGGEDGPTGLYLNEICIFEGLDRKQAESIAERIFRKFPDTGVPDNSRTSLLHGEDSGITTLGL